MSNPKKKKKIGVKKAYTKRSPYWDKFKQTPKPAEDHAHKPDDEELVGLYSICEILSNWTPEQRRRNLAFVQSKYSDDFSLI